MKTTEHELGRAVFASAVGAAVDDFSQVSAAHLKAAIDYAEAVHYLLPRASQVLRLLKAELARRPKEERS